jgi:hypothetical protein
MVEMQDIEIAISQLQSLSKKQPLKGIELAKAKTLMAALKKAGYTNKQVEHLIAGAWSEATVKFEFKREY